MGVPGLRTYASKKLVAKHRLRNAILVIDGLSLQQDLYRRHLPKGGSAQPFGGDYNRFAATVEAFFRALLQVGVTPVVIMDGSVPPEKLATKLKRFNAQLAVSKAVYDGRPTGGVINALLNPELFVQVRGGDVCLFWAVCKVIFFLSSPSDSQEAKDHRAHGHPRGGRHPADHCPGPRRDAPFRRQ